MIGWLVCQRNYIDNLSPTSRQPTLFPGGFRWSANGCWWPPSSFWSARGFLDAASTTIDNQTRLPYSKWIYIWSLKSADWWRNRGRVVLSWSATGRRLVVGADLHNQLYHPHFKRNSQHVFMKLSTYGRKNVGISFEGRVIQKIMQITSRQTVGDQSAITLQMVADQVPKCEVCSIISRRVIGNWLSTTVGDRSANSRRSVGKQSATDWGLKFWLEIGCW